MLAFQIIAIFLLPNHPSFMYSRILVSVLFSILFALQVAALAAPQPGHQLERRLNASSLISDGTSIEGKIATDVKGIFETVTSVGDKAFTIITSAGGEGFTLATSGAGEIKTVFGKVYTIATGVIENTPTSSSTKNAAFAPHAGVQTSLLVALGSVLVGALLGMMMTL